MSGLGETSQVVAIAINLVEIIGAHLYAGESPGDAFGVKTGGKNKLSSIWRPVKISNAAIGVAAAMGREKSAALSGVNLQYVDSYRSG